MGCVMKFHGILGKRGAAITEYAVLLAFVAAIGASFTASGGLADSIRGAVDKAEKVLAAVEPNPPGSIVTPGGGSSGGSEEGGSVIKPEDTQEPPKTDSSEEGNDTSGGNDSSGNNVNPPQEPNTTPSGNFGFYDNDDNDKYAPLFDTLIDYVLTDKDGYKKEDIVGASLNGKNFVLTYKDGTKVKLQDYDEKINLNGYHVQSANLSFKDGKLINGDDDSTLFIKASSDKPVKFTLDKNDNMFHRDK